MSQCFGYNVVGVVHGRFQPFHLGHLKYVSLVYNKVDSLIIGITNPDPQYTKYDPSEPKRHLLMHNPFTFYERYFMIKQALIEEGFDLRKVNIVPFPINIIEVIEYYIPKCAIHFIVNYEKWSEKKKNILEKLGYQVELIPPHEFITISGYTVRKLIAENGNWETLVPKAVANFIKLMNLDKRIKELWVNNHDI